MSKTLEILAAIALPLLKPLAGLVAQGLIWAVNKSKSDVDNQFLIELAKKLLEAGSPAPSE